MVGGSEEETTKNKLIKIKYLPENKYRWLIGKQFKEIIRFRLSGGKFSFPPPSTHLRQLLLCQNDTQADNFPISEWLADNKRDPRDCEFSYFIFGQFYLFERAKSYKRKLISLSVSSDQ